MFVKQILVGTWDVFSYLIACDTSKKAAIIDPGGSPDMLAQISKEEGFTVEYIINTHGHSDHTAGNMRLKEITGAKIIMHADDAIGYQDIDITLTNEETIQVGLLALTVIHTPGHTPGGICLYSDGQLFTGDTLFVKDSGRTDLPGGDRKTLAASIRDLMKLPNDTVVWPGHNYGPTEHSTIGWEKMHNVNAIEYGFYENLPLRD